MKTIEERLDQAAEEVRLKVGKVPGRRSEAVARRAWTGRALQGLAAATLLVALIAGSGFLFLGDDRGGSVASGGNGEDAVVTTTTLVPDERQGTERDVTAGAPTAAGSLPRLVLSAEGWVLAEADDWTDVETGIGYTMVGYYLPTPDGANTKWYIRLKVRGYPVGSEYETTLPFWFVEPDYKMSVRGHAARVYRHEAENVGYTILWRESDEAVAYMAILGISDSDFGGDVESLIGSIVEITEAEWDGLESNPAPPGVTTTTMVGEADQAEQGTVEEQADQGTVVGEVTTSTFRS